MKVSISYQTLTTPPPFAYGYTLSLELNEETLAVEFALEYLNRGEVTNEELEAEGFTQNDDFSWSGELLRVWRDRIKVALDILQVHEVSQDEDTWLFMRLENTEKPLQGHPVNLEEWNFLLQELMQAIFEKAGKEAPFLINLLNIAESSTNYHVFGSFERLEARINESQVSWETLKQLMELVYSFDVSDQVEKKPKKPGIWVDQSGEGYYQRIMESSNKKHHTDQILVLLKS